MANGIILTGICAVCSFKLVYGQSIQPGESSNIMFDEGIVLTSLIVSVLAGIGVVSLAIFILCYLFTNRKNMKLNPHQSVRSRRSFHHVNLTEKASHYSDLHVEGTDLSTVPLEPANICMGVETLRNVTLNLFRETIGNLYNIRVKGDHKRHKYQIKPDVELTVAPESENSRRYLKKRLELIFYNDSSKIHLFLSIEENILSGNTVRLLMDVIFRVCRVARGIVREWGMEKKVIAGTVPEDGPSYFNFTIEESVNKVKITWNDQKFSHEFLNTVSLILQALRDERRLFTPVDYLAIHLAYHCIAGGKQLILNSHRALGPSGFRPYTQTYISLSDPGDGHVLGTTRFNDSMNGTSIHVQQLGRPSIELYHGPSLYDFSRVRLHVGSTAPNTFLVERNMKESDNFGSDIKTLVRMTSSVASAAFYQGAAECMFTMSGLSTSQAVQYMKALGAEVHRDPHSQLLSTVWNVNQSLLNDFENDTPSTLNESFDIAHCLIQITCMGGFDKLVWDATSDSSQSKCIMDLFTAAEGLSLVHDAHSKGLIAQFSGRFNFGEIKHAVFTGADGIGIGGAPLLRLMDHETGAYGPYMEENIPQILRERDTAADTFGGKGVFLLTRLDKMYFEGCISSAENGMRCQLFNALMGRDEAVVTCILEKMQNVLNIPCEYGCPLIGVAHRLVDSKAPLLKEVSDSNSDWVMFITRLRTLIQKYDIKGITEAYEGEPWVRFRHIYLESNELRDQGGSSQTSSTQM